jgi:hypothetical protein
VVAGFCEVRVRLTAFLGEVAGEVDGMAVAPPESLTVAPLATTQWCPARAAFPPARQR